MFKNSVLKFCFIFLLLNQQSYAQCPNPTVLFTEDFETTPIVGAITSVIYGQGNWTNTSYTLSGSAHGWFNVINNLGDVDFYDRQVSNLCVGESVEATFWTRHSFGSTNVTYSLIDDFGVAIATTTLSLTSTYQQITLNAVVTSPNIRLVMHMNSNGGNGNDVIIEDIVMSQCSNFPTEQVNHVICNNLNTVDLSSLFSANIPNGGTWSGPSLLSSGSLGTYDPNVNLAGIYTYTPPNGATCASILSSTVNVNFISDFDLGVDTIICSGSNLVLSAPANFDSYAWNNTANTQSISVNTANTYSVNATINSTPNCVISDTIIVGIQTPTQTLTATPPICNQDANGMISVDNPLATEYSIDNGITWQVDSIFVNLPNGVYDVCSRTNIGCIICENIQLNTLPIQISASGDTTICENGTVMLNAQASGGNTFLYNWSFTANQDANQTVNPLTSQTYTVFAENELGCTSINESINVTILPPLTGLISQNLEICDADSSTIVAVVSGGSGIGYTFNWNTGNSQTGTNIDSLVVYPNTTTNYLLSITDNCESTPLMLSTDVIVHPLPNPNYIIPGNPFCEPAEIEIIDATTNVIVENVDWTIAGNQNFANQDTIITAPLFEGSYDIAMDVTSTEGCFTSFTFLNAIDVEAPPVSNFSYNPDPVTMFNTVVQFTESSIGAINYEWIFPEAVPTSSSLEDPVVTYPDGVADEYQVTLVSTSAAGCSDTIIKTITVYPDLIIYAPNSFTPDADEYNPTWRVFMQGIDFYDFNLTIFNRWGQIVWESNNIEIGWDATFGGKAVEEGVYVWKVNTKDLLTDKTYEFNGHINVLK